MFETAQYKSLVGALQQSQKDVGVLAAGSQQLMVECVCVQDPGGESSEALQHQRQVPGITGSFTVRQEPQSKGT